MTRQGSIDTSDRMTSTTQHTNGDIMRTSPHTQAIDTINNFSAYRLSLKANVESPDALDSPGAQTEETDR